jgi:hypothetical protein
MAQWWKKTVEEERRQENRSIADVVMNKNQGRRQALSNRQS